MDPQKMKEAYQKLESLDERLTFKIRSRGTTVQPTTDQLNAKLNDVASYTIELKEIMQEFMLAFATRRPEGPPPAG
jgi:hypothetical protein